MNALTPPTVSERTVFRGRPAAFPEHGGPFFFTEDKEFAREWAHHRHQDIGNIFTAKISMANALVTNDMIYTQQLRKFGQLRDALLATLKSQGYDGVIYSTVGRKCPIYIVFDEKNIQVIGREESVLRRSAARSALES